MIKIQASAHYYRRKAINKLFCIYYYFFFLNHDYKSFNTKQGLLGTVVKLHFLKAKLQALAMRI